LEVEFILIAQLTRNIVVVLVRFSMVLPFAYKKTDDTDQRGPFVAYDGLLHSADGTVVYVSRYQDPWKSQRKNE
jgi:hypothetical protein